MVPGLCLETTGHSLSDYKLIAIFKFLLKEEQAKVFQDKGAVKFPEGQDQYKCLFGTSAAAFSFWIDLSLSEEMNFCQCPPL